MASPVIHRVVNINEFDPRAVPKNAIPAPGRRAGTPHGTYVSDLTELKKTLLLCTFCQPKFDPRRANYYIDRRFARFGANGPCDACRKHCEGGQLYFHESLVGTKSGQCVTPV